MGVILAGAKGDGMEEVMQGDVRVRRAAPEDAGICGEICYRAFSAISGAHNFPCDIPNPDVAKHFLSLLFSVSGFYGVVAERAGHIVGSNVLDERSIIAGVGPVTIDPEAQNRGIGRVLMEAVMDRARESHAAGVRLVQAAFHNRSLSLYTRLGFDVREPLACVQGRTRQRAVAGCTVRAATPADVEACNALSRRVHGFDRGMELAQAVERQTALVVERGGQVTGYASELSFFGHATCESNQDLQALLVSVESFGGSGILVPARNSAFFRWCLENGLQVVQPMTLMSAGLYNEPAGAWLASITF